MSHITDVKLLVRDLDAVEEAANRLGFDLRLGQKTFAWYGRFMGDSSGYGNRDPKDFGKCDHALRLKDHTAGDYEIGLTAEADGSYSLLYDSWGPGQRVEAAAGQRLNTLRREYAAAVATRRAKAKLAPKGFVVKREDIGNRIRLRLVRR